MKKTINNFSYTEFLDRYVENHEEFSFVYKKMKIWLINDTSGFHNIVFSIDNNHTLEEKAFDLLSLMSLDKKLNNINLNEILIYEVNFTNNNYLEKIITNFNYCLLIENLINKHKVYKLHLKDKDLLIYYYSDKNFETIVCKQTFDNPNESLAFRINNKSIEEIWEELL